MPNSPTIAQYITKVRCAGACYWLKKRDVNIKRSSIKGAEITAAEKSGTGKSVSGTK
jgi:hypothetical protein